MKRLIAFIPLIFAFIACTNNSNENLASDLLVGTWSKTFSTDEPNFEQSIQYVFGSDNTVITSLVISNTSTSEVVGYRSRALGTYSVIEDILNTNLSEIYTHDDSTGLFSSLEDLEVSDGPQTETVTISFSDNGETLTFIYPPCPPNANCIGSQTFIRQ